MAAGYLTAERDLGRVAADADGTPEPAAVARVVAAVLAAARPPQ